MLATPPDLADLISQWRLDPLIAVLATAAAIGYVRTRIVGARRGVAWPLHRDVIFGVGVAAAVWVGCGVAQARAAQLMWVWMAQQLCLLLVVPVILLSAQPLSLIRAVQGPNALLFRALDWRPLRILGHPLVGLALVPVSCGLLVFGSVGEAALTHVWIGWLVDVALLFLGILIALPLLDSADSRSSLAVGMSIAIGFIEIFIDAVPGLVLRFETHPMIEYFTVHRPAWSPSWLRDQKSSGGLLWIVAETIDLPFLAVAMAVWLRADAREAARIDARLDALATARIGGATVNTPQSAGEVAGGNAEPSMSGRTQVPEHNPHLVSALDRPWWLDDPELRDRYGR